MNHQSFHTDDFSVSLGNALISALIHGNPGLWVRLGNLESKLLEKLVDAVRIERPVFIAGLPRSGSTLVLELLASINGVATQRYRDFPPIFTPYWWNRLVDLLPRRTLEPVERAHGDGIYITPESPEAMEEPIWMAFFPGAHDPDHSQVLDVQQQHAEFARFYRHHISKLLLLRGANRYASKNHYNITRLDFLLSVFPDARFVIPVRDPANQIASLMKQHALFSEAEKAHPRALEQMRQMGHFEFGLDRRPINTGDRENVGAVLNLWKTNQEVRGWARYWTSLYGYVADRLDSNRALRDASMVLCYEKLCQSREEMIRTLLSHCGFMKDESLVREFSQRLSAPADYGWTEQERAVIAEETRAVAVWYGY